MPVIYGSGTGNKGFLPCSRPYRQAVLQALQRGDTASANELFQQSHRLSWQRVPGTDHYTHRFRPGMEMSVEEYNAIVALPPNQLTPARVEQQCGPGPGPRPTAFIGPQVTNVLNATKTMQQVQKDSNENAARHGFSVDKVKGLATYAPSPFQQVRDAQGIFHPVSARPQPGQSAGVCRNIQTRSGGRTACDPPLVCEKGVCVIPTAQRQCPPFQYPVVLQNAGGNGGEQDFTIENPSARRTVQQKKYSTFWNQWYQTCGPDPDYSTQRWIEDPRLREYIGLALDVRFLPEPTWTARATLPGVEVLRDPSTFAPYFLNVDPGGGNVFRVYKLNTPYTPVLPEPGVNLEENVAQLLRQVAAPEPPANLEENVAQLLRQVAERA